jgi:hypothetical protein
MLQGELECYGWVTHDYLERRRENPKLGEIFG